VHLRRAILLFALVLGLTALAAAVSPTRDASQSTVTTAVPPGAPVGPLARAILFNSPPGARALERRAHVGDHLLVSVVGTEGGLVTIPRLGRTASASPYTAARFDLLAPAPGRYDVLFAPSGSTEPRRVGTIVTRP
jgi:hypothetical protein